MTSTIPTGIIEEPTLAEALTSLGLTHRPGTFQRREVRRGKRLLGQFNARECWALVHALEGGADINAAVKAAEEAQ